MNKLSHTAFVIALLGFIVGVAGTLAGLTSFTAYGLTTCVIAGMVGAATSRP